MTTMKIGLYKKFKNFAKINVCMKRIYKRDKLISAKPSFWEYYRDKMAKFSGIKKANFVFYYIWCKFVYKYGNRIFYQVLPKFDKKFY